MGFSRNLAWLVGIDRYVHVTPLDTAARDATAIGALLQDEHDYVTQVRCDGEADLAGLTQLFSETLPATVTADDRVVIYFAGHGIAQDGDDGPTGFLVPVDATPDDRASLLPMVDVLRALETLPCRHLLLVLDCCFAGSFRWASTRSFLPQSAPLTRKRYERFLDDPAWQVLTSAADDQKALDVLDGLTIGARQVSKDHSPFAAALLDGLRGGADRPGADGEKDGVVTAAELYNHVRDIVELGAEEQGKTQTPGLWPLPLHGRGEFLFHVPGGAVNLRPDPVLDEAANPWRGLAPYEAEHRSLFFGRDRVVDALKERLLATDDRFIAVFGASGTGKSSVVKAGLLPILEHEHDQFAIVGPLRPGTEPLRLRDQLRAALATPSDRTRLIVIDQFEEIWTMCRVPELRDTFLRFLADGLESDASWRLLVTARSDFSPQIAHSPLGAHAERARFMVPAFTAEELRAIVTGPAQVRVLYFEPPELADAIVEEVYGVPGALPLLSFTLAELYRAYIAREADDRALIQADYDALGGVVGALRTRASELYARYDAEHQEALRNVMLRLVATQGGELAKRRAFTDELDMSEVAHHVVDDFVRARLFVMGSVGDGDAARSYVEPAHDMLVIAWDQVHAWMDDHGEALPLLRRLWPAAWEWHQAGADKAARPLLWIESPHLPAAWELHEAPSTLLNTVERAFVGRSSRRKSLRRMGLLFNLAAVGIVLLALAGASLFYGLQANKRAKETAEALAAQELALENMKHAQVAELNSREQTFKALAASEARGLALQVPSEIAAGRVQTGALIAVEAVDRMDVLPEVRSAVRLAAARVRGRPLARPGVLPREVRVALTEDEVAIEITSGGWRGMGLIPASGRWSIPDLTPLPMDGLGISDGVLVEGELPGRDALTLRPWGESGEPPSGTHAGHTEPGPWLATSPDGRWLLSADSPKVDTAKVGHALRLTPLDGTWPGAPWGRRSGLAVPPHEPPGSDVDIAPVTSWTVDGATVEAMFMATSRGNLTTLNVTEEDGTLRGGVLIQAAVEHARPLGATQMVVLAGYDSWTATNSGRLHLAPLSGGGASHSTDELRRTIVLNRDRPDATAFTVRDDTIVAGLADGTVWLWTVAAGGVTEEFLTEHGAPIVDVVISRDGRWFVTSDRAGRAHVTPRSIDGYAAMVRAAVGRPLTPQERQRFHLPDSQE